MVSINPYQLSVAFHIETSQLTGFYLKCNTWLKWVNRNIEYLDLVNSHTKRIYNYDCRSGDTVTEAATEVVLSERCSWEFRKIHRKTPVPNFIKIETLASASAVSISMFRSLFSTSNIYDGHFWGGIVNSFESLTIFVFHRRFWEGSYSP